MNKISPWFLLLAVISGLYYFTAPNGARPSPDARWLALPAFIVVFVALDHVVLPRVRWGDRKKAIARDLTWLVLTILLVWVMRPSTTVSAILIVVALRKAWSILGTHNKSN